jgi:hypothetical protein
LTKMKSNLVLKSILISDILTAEQLFPP